MCIEKRLGILFILVFQLLTEFVSAQTSKIALLKSAFYRAASETQKLDAALALCGESHSLNIDTLYQYAHVARQMAISAHDPNRLMLANTFVETWMGRKNYFDSALNICNSDISRLHYQHAADLYSVLMMQKCGLLVRNHRHKEALDQTYHFLGEAEKLEDTAAQIYCKCIIGMVYRNMEQTELALQWFYRADQTVAGDNWQRLKNEYGVYFHLGMMYNWKVNADTSQKNAISDSALSLLFIDKAVMYSRKYENLGMLARSLNVKAAIIGSPANLLEEGNYIQEARHIYEDLRDTLSLLNCISPMCFYFIDAGHPEKGIEACEQGIEMIKRGNNFPLMDLYEAMGQCYKAAGNYQKYAETLNNIIGLKDTLYKKNFDRDLADLNAKYEGQKKENTIIQQKLDIAAKKNSIYAVSILTGILLIGILALYRHNYKKQQKQKQNEILAVASAEEAERRRISADLHDNIGAYAAAAASTIATIRIKDEEDRGSLARLNGNVQEMITQLNDSIWALNKKAVRLTGVSDRFKVFVKKLEPAYPHIKISFHEEIETDCLLSPFQALHLSRMLQEALNNALKHSEGSEISIKIFCSTDTMRITIADNGTGMKPGRSNGNGINNLKTRARETGWLVEWLDNEGFGTTVRITAAFVPQIIKESES